MPQVDNSHSMKRNTQLSLKENSFISVYNCAASVLLGAMIKVVLLVFSIIFAIV